MLLVGMALPGPANLAVLAAGLAGGLRPAAALAAGVAAGDTLLAAAVVGGAGALARSQSLQTAMGVGGGLLLVLIGLRMLGPPSAAVERDLPGEGAPWRGAGGIALGLGNPKAVLLHLAAAPLVVGEGQAGAVLVLAAAAGALGLNGLALTPYFAAPWFAERLALGRRASRAVHLACGGLLAAAGLGLALRAGLA